MLPTLSIEWFGLNWSISVNAVLALTALVFSWTILMSGMPTLAHAWRAAVLVLGIGIAGLVGGRLLHVLWERPELLAHPAAIFSRWDGLVFYGALASGALAAGFLIRLLFKAEERARIWDRGAIACAMSYAVLRVGCFAEGCCWGKVCAYPWAVRFPFRPDSLMPAPGIPVHPTQLYDAICGGIIAMALWYADTNLTAHRRFKFLRGSLFALFCALYAIARFITENFRGDSFRKDQVLVGLSTSQLISVTLLLVSSSLLLVRISQSRRKVILGVLATLSLSGCILPEAPSKEMFLVRDTIRPGWERYVSNPKQFHIGERAIVRGNALYLTADSSIFHSFLPQVQQALGTDTPPSLDDLVWWEHGPILSELYEQIYRITYSEAKFATVIDTLKALEAIGKPFDVYLLSHGFPNHLSGGEGYFLSYRELVALKGRFKHLNLVFMQSCYGVTLAQEWLSAGARAVISFEGFNRNFFWISFFLRWYRYFDFPEALAKTNTSIDFNLHNEFLYMGLLEALGLTPDAYLAQTANPVLMQLLKQR